MADTGSKTRKRSTYAALAVLLIALVAMGAAGYNAWRGIERQGGLTQILQDSLNNRTPGVFVTIESTKLQFRLSRAPVRLVAENVRLGAVDTALDVPRSEFGFSLSSLVAGSFVPTEMEVTGLDLDIEHGPGGWQAGPSAALLLGLLGDGGEAGDGFGDFRRFRILDARLAIAQSGRNENAEGGLFIIEPINITLNHRNGRVSGSIEATDPEGGTASAEISSNAGMEDIDLSAAVAGLRVSSIYPYLGVDLPEISEVGVVDGEIAVSIRDRQLDGISGDITTLAGRLGIPGRDPLEVVRAELVFTHDASTDILTVSNLDILAPGPSSESQPWRFLVSGQVRDLSTDAPVVFSSIRGSNLPLEPLLNAWPAELEPAARRLITGSVQGGSVASLGLETVGVIDRVDRQFQVTSIDVVAELRSMRLETSFASVERLVGTLSSRLELSMSPGGTIDHAAANLLLEDAQLLPKESSELVDLEGIELRGKLEGNTLVLERAAIDARDLGQLALQASFDLDPDRHARRMDFQIRAEQIDLDLMTSLWPRDVRSGTRQWASSNVEGGVINGLVIDAGFNLQDDGGFETLYLMGNADLVGVDLQYIRGMPPLEGVSASIGFEGRTLRADLLAGAVEGLAIGGSRFIIRASDQGPQADLALLARGDFGGAVRLLDHERLNLLAPAGIVPVDAAGTINATMGAKWIIPRAGQSVRETGGIDITMSATVEGAMLDGLPYETGLENGFLNIVLARNDLSVSGRGDIEGAPTVLDLRRRADGHVEMDLAIAKSEQFTALIKSRVPINLDGSTAGMIKLKGNPRMEDLVMDARLDFNDASFNLSRLGLAKLPGEEAELVAQLRIAEGKVVGIDGIQLASDVLSASGSISFDESGRFLGALFEEIVWPGYDLKTISAERNAEDILRISAEAGTIDLTPLRREESPGEGLSLEIEITAERIILDQFVSLSGNVLLRTREDGTGEAEFLGALFLDNEPFMTETSFKALFGGGQDTMEGIGLIGGVEATLSLGPGESGSVMRLTSESAGQILRTLGITEAIRRGSLDMAVAFDGGQRGHYDVEFELGNFNVIDAPRVVRWMSVLSVPGLFSLLDGDGTNFREGYARIEVFPDRQVIHQARATGAAVGVEVVGVIHPEEGTMEVSGTLVPLNLITEILGFVPLVGQILTGLDNSGLFATQFTLKGPIDDPEGTVNRSSLAPGFVRDIFSPDWVRRERERLIPEEGSDTEAGGGNAEPAPSG